MLWENEVWMWEQNVEDIEGFPEDDEKENVFVEQITPRRAEFETAFGTVTACKTTEQQSPL